MRYCRQWQYTQEVHTGCRQARVAAGNTAGHGVASMQTPAIHFPTHLPWPCTLRTLRTLAGLTAQVSHHPPIGAGHAETELWSYDLVSAPKTKFLGNSVEVYPIGELDI